MLKMCVCVHMFARVCVCVFLNETCMGYCAIGKTSEKVAPVHVVLRYKEELAIAYKQWKGL